MKKLPVPEPVTTAQVCSVCGEDWARHPDNPSLLDCITVLRMRPRSHVFTYSGGSTVTQLNAVAHNEAAAG